MNRMDHTAAFRRSVVVGRADPACHKYKGGNVAQIGVVLWQHSFSYVVVLRLFACHYPSRPLRRVRSQLAR